MDGQPGKRAVLFDLEGTLVDFQWNLRSAADDVKEVLCRMGFDPSGWEDHYAALRNNAILGAAKMGLDKRQVAGRIDAIYDRYDLDACSRWSLLPQAAAVLRYMRDEKKVALGLVSNIGRKAVEQGTLRLGLAGLFDVTITRDDVELLKPSGQGIRMALGKLGARSSDALFVGDSVSDVLAAKDAGVKVAIVQGGESAFASLTMVGPDYLWQDLHEIKSLRWGGERNAERESESSTSREGHGFSQAGS